MVWNGLSGLEAGTTHRAEHYHLKWTRLRVDSRNCKSEGCQLSITGAGESSGGRTRVSSWKGDDVAYLEELLILGSVRLVVFSSGKEDERT